MGETAGMRYWTALQAILQPMVVSQSDPIQRAADLVVHALAKGHRLYIYDTGHMLQRELVNRAGGLIAMTPLTFDLHIDHTIAHEAPRSRSGATEEEVRGYVAYALKQADVHPGDVVIAASVTGARVLPVEVALQLKTRGIRIIGLTSREYSAFVPAQHSSGKKLIDFSEIVIDNACTVGDAVLSISGFGDRVGPTTGISAAILMWMLCAEVVERQVGSGATPRVLESMNLPGAPERNRTKALQYLAHELE